MQPNRIPCRASFRRPLACRLKRFSRARVPRAWILARRRRPREVNFLPCSVVRRTYSWKNSSGSEASRCQRDDSSLAIPRSSSRVSSRPLDLRSPPRSCMARKTSPARRWATSFTSTALFCISSGRAAFLTY